MTAHITYDRQALIRICQRHGVKRLALFGSVVRDDFGPLSDVDVLIDFKPSRVPDLFEFGILAEELAALFGRRVDLVTSSSLKNPYRRASILEDAEVQFDEAG